MIYPELIFTEKNLKDLLGEISDDNTLLVTDPYNYNAVKNYGRIILVENNFYCLSSNDIRENYSKVISVGGCSALDIGRACAEGLNFIAIPTVLSTSCISVNISILRAKDRTRRIKTVVPDKTIVSFPVLLDTAEEELWKWSSSGFGDLFANISASIDYEYKNKSSSIENIFENSSEAICALQWVYDNFKSYDRLSLGKLANYLHNSSLDVIRAGHNQLSAGCEHELYETLIRQEKYSNTIQTHGIIVSLGTLITVAIFEKLNNLNFLFGKLKEVYKKLKLPYELKEFEAIGIKRKHIIKALKNLKSGNSIMAEYFAKEGYSLLEKL